MRDGVIRAALRRLGAILTRLLLRWTGLRAGFVLVYHHVTPDQGAAPRGPVQVTSGDDLAAHLRHLRRAFRVVPASGVLAAAAQRRRGERFPVAVTFDDDLPSHEQVVLPILVDLGLPATFFVGGRGLGPSRELWSETLERGLAAGLAEELARDLGADPPAPPGEAAWAIADRLLKLSPEEREAWRRALASRLGEPVEPAGLTRSQLRALVLAGFELGWHTLAHENLVQLDDAALDRALTEGREALAQVAGRALTALSYPYGRTDERVALAARRQGFELGFTAREECVTPATDPMRIGRVEPAVRSGGALTDDLTRRLRGLRSPPRPPGNGLASA